MNKRITKYLLLRILKWDKIRYQGIGGHKISSEGLKQAAEIAAWITEGGIREIPLRYMLAKTVGPTLYKQAWEY